MYEAVAEHEGFDEETAGMMKLIVNGKVIQPGHTLDEYLGAGKGRTLRARNMDGTKRPPESLPKWRRAKPYAGIIWLSSRAATATATATAKPAASGEETE